MWDRLSGVASNVAGLVGQANDERLQSELDSTRDALNVTREELKAALRTIKERDQEILNLSRTEVPSSEVSFVLNYRVRNYWGRVTNFNQSEARTHCFLASDWLKFETLPRKFRTLLSCIFLLFCVEVSFRFHLSCDVVYYGLLFFIL